MRKKRQVGSNKKRRKGIDIDLRHKGLVTAAEPPKDRDLANLDSNFRGKLLNVLSALQGSGKPFQFNEGYRTIDRQQWLYGSGRPHAKPYGREGRIITNADGVKKRSSHQGNGSAGSGLAADCYPIDSTGKIYIPDIADPIWKIYADAVTKEGLEAGYYWQKLKDAPHCESILQIKPNKRHFRKMKNSKRKPRRRKPR